jgi:hypothetical protein
VVKSAAAAVAAMAGTPQDQWRVLDPLTGAPLPRPHTALVPGADVAARLELEGLSTRDIGPFPIENVATMKAVAAEPSVYVVEGFVTAAECAGSVLPWTLKPFSHHPVYYFISDSPYKYTGGRENDVNVYELVRLG